MNPLHDMTAEADLFQEAVLASKEMYEKHKGEDLDVVVLRVNAHANGYYAAYRFVKKPRAKYHWVPRWASRTLFFVPAFESRVRPLHPIHDAKMAGWACEQYLDKYFKGVKDEQRKRLINPFVQGFILGGERAFES